MPEKETPAKIDLEALSLSDEMEARQFVLKIGEHRARMEYDRSSGDRIFLTRLEVPPALDVEEVSAVLTEKVLNWAEANKLKVVPYCAYVKTFLRRHTAWQRLLVKGVQL
ncbi:MAG: GNAT family N-acetyltransferase [Flavobacteriales bacterium]